MNETPNDPDKAAKEAKATRNIRYAWMVVILISVISILFNLYDWRNNDSSLSSILTPLGLIFLVLAMIVGDEKKVPHYILLGIAMILIFSQLAWLIFR